MGEGQAAARAMQEKNHLFSETQFFTGFAFRMENKYTLTSYFLPEYGFHTVMATLSGAMLGLHPPAIAVIMLAVMLHLAPRTNAAPWHQQQPHDQPEKESKSAEQTLS